MKRKILVSIFVTAIAVILLSLNLSADVTTTISDNRYETSETIKTIPAEEITGLIEFVFESSPALRGRVDVLSSEGDEIEIYYHKVLYAQNREQADSFANMISLRHEIIQNSLYLFADAPRNAPWRRTANLSGQIELEIRLPQEYSVNVHVSGYRINIGGPFPYADLGGEYCEEIRALRINGGLKIEAENSPIIIRDIVGPADIKARGANISARNIVTEVGISTFENRRGAISLIGFEGDELRVQAEKGKINIEKLTLNNGRRAYISNSGINSDIYVEVSEIFKSRLEVVNKSSDVQVLLPRDVSAEFLVTTDPDEGEIEVSGIPLVTEEVDWGTLFAHTYSHDSRIVVDTRGAGKVTIRRKGY